MPTTQELFLRKVYTYLSTNTSDCEIMKADNTEFTNFLRDAASNSNNERTADPEKKKWWQILVNAIINVGVEILSGGTVHTNIDLFP